MPEMDQAFSSQRSRVFSHLLFSFSYQVDVYSLGNIFYMLLMQNYPFRDTRWKEAAKLVQEGHRPHVFPHVWNSTHPVDQVLKQAMIMCHAQEPEDRATARQVETYLQQELQRLDPGRLESWGVLSAISSHRYGNE
jgi:serine/threonine protein kinase